MNAPRERRSPAPALASGLDRAGIIRSGSLDTTNVREAESLAPIWRGALGEMALDVAACALTLAGFAPCVSMPVIENAISRLRDAVVEIGRTFREAEAAETTRG